MFQFGFCVLLASGKMTNNRRYDSLETNNQMRENVVVFLNCYCCTIGETELIGRLINAYYIIKGTFIFRMSTMELKSLFLCYCNNFNSFSDIKSKFGRLLDINIQVFLIHK